MKYLAILIAAALAGCAGLTTHIVTPYGTITSDGKTVNVDANFKAVKPAKVQ